MTGTNTCSTALSVHSDQTMLLEDDEELLAIKEELSELDVEVESNEQDDELEKSELLSSPIEDDELVDEVIEELLHTSTVLQTLTS